MSVVQLQKALAPGKLQKNFWEPTGVDKRISDTYNLGFWYTTFEGLSQNECQYQHSALQGVTLLETFYLPPANLSQRYVDKMRKDNSRWGGEKGRGRDELMAVVPEVHLSTVTVFA